MIGGAWSSAWFSDDAAGSSLNVGLRDIEVCAVSSCRSIGHGEYTEAMERVMQVKTDPAMRAELERRMPPGSSRQLGLGLKMLDVTYDPAEVARWQTYSAVAFWGRFGAALVLLLGAAASEGSRGLAGLGAVSCAVVAGAAWTFCKGIPDGYLPSAAMQMVTFETGYAVYACIGGAGLGIVGSVLCGLGAGDGAGTWDVGGGDGQTVSRSVPALRAPACSECGEKAEWREDVAMYICKRCGLAV